MANSATESDDGMLPNEQPMSQLIHGAARFLRIVWYRKQVLGVAAVVAALLGLLYYATAPRFYQADASVLILQVGDSSAPNVGVESTKNDIMPTYQQLARSAVVLDDAIKRLRPEHLVDFQNVPRNEWTKALNKGLSISGVRQTNILDVKYQSRDPVVAVEVVKALREAYFDFVERTYKHTAAEITDILRRERGEIEKSLTAKEAELIAFRQSHGDLGISSTGQTVQPLVQRALSLNDALIQAMQKRLELQSSLAAVQVAVRNGESLQPHVMAMEGVVGREMLLTGLGFSDRDAQVQANLERTLLTDRAKLETVKQYLGPAHPKHSELAQRIQVTEKYLLDYRDRLTRSLSDLQDKQLGPMLLQMLQQSLARSFQQESALRESFEAARQEAVMRNGELATIETLEHDVQRLRGMHDALVSKIASADLWQQHGEIRLAVVKEPEVPTSPSSPRLFLVVVVCVLGAVSGGSIIVAVQDALDDRFRSPEELRARLGIQTLAIIRNLNSLDGGGVEGLQVFTEPDSLESEAFRTLRTALAFSAGDSTKLVISSSEPGDGKTTVLANLAVSIAQSGKRTLLIDADLRRPGMTALLAMKGMVGLSDLLLSDENLEKMLERCVRRTAVDTLDVIPSGPRRPNPAEMLSGTRLADLLAWAEGRYDQILVDAPPVLAASDALMIGRLVDGAVLVVQPEKNRRRLVTRAAESFQGVGVPLLGVVANRVGQNGQDYAYSYGYAYNYQYGEPVTEEELEEGYGDDQFLENDDDQDYETNDVSLVHADDQHVEQDDQFEEEYDDEEYSAEEEQTTDDFEDGPSLSYDDENESEDDVGDDYEDEDDEGERPSYGRRAA
ncbi:MAG: polysaccharide biosynthesis tyrosine autokinase [Planctomycetes bacterium]|nr:polysaccharide biosynthesis tyrosine autokinase [Planctomycetota bacterium]